MQKEFSYYKDINYYLKSKLWQKLVSLGEKKVFVPNTMIYLQEDNSRNLYCLISGHAKNCYFLNDGTERIFNFLYAPNISGETSLFDKQPYLCAMVTISKCTISVVPFDTLERELSNNIEFSNFMLTVMAKKMRCAHLHARYMAGNISQRVANVLISYPNFSMADSLNQEIVISQADLARLLSASRPMVNQQLKQFCNQGLIACNRGKITILDLKGLQDVAVL